MLIQIVTENHKKIKNYIMKETKDENQIDYFIPYSIMTDDPKVLADFVLKFEARGKIKSITHNISVVVDLQKNQPVAILCAMVFESCTKEEFDKWMNSKIIPLQNNG